LVTAIGRRRESDRKKGTLPAGQLAERYGNGIVRVQELDTAKLGSGDRMPDGQRAGAA
jgi:hypothetical protein